MADDTHIEVTLRLPRQKGLELMEFMQQPMLFGNAPAVLWPRPDGIMEVMLPAKNNTSGFAVPPLADQTAADSSSKSVTGQKSNGRTPVVVGDLAIHPGRHEVTFKGKAIPHLTHTKFEILYCLACRPGWVFSREEIVHQVKGKGYAVTDRAVDVQIAGLRKVMGVAAGYVQTVRGVGYRIKV